MEIPLDIPGVRLRPWRFGDEEALARHADNIKIARYLSGAFPHPYTRSDARAFIRSIESTKPPRTLAIEVDGEPCGSIGLVPGADIYEHSAELGYWLGEAYWGQGIMTVATRAITNYGFNDLGFRRIYATVFASNLASARVLEKAGYRFEGRRRNAVIKFGELMDDLLYAILPGDVAAE